jgi:hypothetical protein
MVFHYEMRSFSRMGCAPLLFAVLMAFCPAVFSGGAAETARVRENNARALFDFANQERTARGMAALKWNNALAMAAERHAAKMASNGSISHQYAGEPDLPERFRAEGARFSAVAENVALGGNASGVHDQWMHSAGHRANILDANMTQLGVGVVQVNGRVYAVEDFARGVENIPLEEQERRIEQMIAARGLAIAPYKEEARRICDGGRVAGGERRPLFTMRYTTQDLTRLPTQLTTAATSGRYRDATVGACDGEGAGSFSSYHLVVLLF